MVVADEQLGAFIERYETDNHRRGVRALAALVGGVLVTGLGMVMFVPLRAGGGEPPAGAEFVPAVVLGCGLGSVLMGVLQGLRFFKRTDETFLLYEDGLVHTWSGRTQVIRWDDIAKVVDSGKDSMIARAMGGDVNCVISLKPGGRVVITGFTEYADRLAGAVEAAAARQARRTGA